VRQVHVENGRQLGDVYAPAVGEDLVGNLLVQPFGRHVLLAVARVEHLQQPHFHHLLYHLDHVWLRQLETSLGRLHIGELLLQG
jgi:hypothetical protein